VGLLCDYRTFGPQEALNGGSTINRIRKHEIDEKQYDI